MKLSHFTKKPFKKVYSVDQLPREYYSIFDKPKGLWVSVDGEDDWESWCSTEMPEWMNGVKRLAVTLAPDHNVLNIPDDLSMCRFYATFGCDVKPLYGDERRIDWQKVAHQYQGIIIAPYQWPYRMNMGWYYPWDCASGCIWDKRAIQNVELATMQTEPEVSA